MDTRTSPPPALPRSELPAAATFREIPPRLSSDAELLGRYDGSGSMEERYLLGRADGRAIEVSELLYLIASGIDGRRPLADLAAWVSAEGGRRITADQVDYLIEHKLRPLGVIAGPGAEPAPARRRPLLGLTLARAVVEPRAVEAATRVLSPLFHLPVVVAVLVAVVTFDFWVLTGPGIGGAVHRVLATPALLLAMAAITALGGAFHELGHASASRRGGARPGVIGVGIYLLWPVFYNDLNDSYRLSRAARLRVDLGGVYFNAVLIVALAGAYGLTRHPALLVAVVLQHLAIAQQFLPFLRLDGYYIVSDIAGVPDLFARVRPVLTRLVAGRRAAPATSDLRPAARRIVTTWVLVLVPLLAAAVVGLIVSLPGLLATAAGAFLLQLANLMAALEGGDLVALGLSSLQLLVYAVPLVGLGVTLARALGRLFGLAVRRPPPVARAGAGRSRTGERGAGLRAFLGTDRASRMVVGMVALDLCLAIAVLTGVVASPTFSDEPSAPVAAALAVPGPVPPPTTFTDPATAATPTTIVSRTNTAPPTTTAPTAVPAGQRNLQPASAVAPGLIPGPPPPGPVARRQPSSAEVQQAIDGFRPHVRSIVPVSPSPEQVAELGDKICTAFDEGQSVAQIKATGRQMAESVPFATVGPAGEGYILRTGTALYCPATARASLQALLTPADPVRRSQQGPLREARPRALDRLR